MVTGLPRSGSTLLMNILGQNPKSYVTPTSGVLELIARIRNQWDEIAEFRALEHVASESMKVRVMREAFKAASFHPEKEIIFDKSRGWTSFPEVAEMLLGEPAKMIVCVRDLCEVTASLEKLWRKTTATRRTSIEQNNYWAARTAQGRMTALLANDGIVGSCINGIRDCVTRGYRRYMHFVDYDDLCEKPARTMNGIYDFLGVDVFEHDFDDVQQVTKEDDFVHGFVGLHDIRPKVEPQKKTFEMVFDAGFRTTQPIWKSVVEEREFWRPLERL